MRSACVVRTRFILNILVGLHCGGPRTPRTTLGYAPAFGWQVQERSASDPSACGGGGGGGRGTGVARRDDAERPVPAPRAHRRPQAAEAEPERLRAGRAVPAQVLAVRATRDERPRPRDSAAPAPHEAADRRPAEAYLPAADRPRQRAG